MNAKSQPERIWFVVAPLLVWFSTAYSASLTTHLYFVLFQRDALKDGQYRLIFPIGTAAGIVLGIVPAILTVALLRHKSKFALTAFWIALGCIAFWAVTVTKCEVVFARNWFGGGIIMTSVTLTLQLPVTVFCLPLVITEPDWLLFALPPSLSLICALLIAFYFTPPRGWRQGG
jgi:ABC-type uncharacterized transport system permease subunit